MTKSPLLLASIGLAAGLLAACASTQGSDGPTVPVLVDTIPGNTRIYVDDTRAGDSPAKVNLLVDADGRLAYDVDITADFSASKVAQALGPSTGAKSEREPVYVRLKKGEVPPGQVSFSNGFGSKMGQSLTLNPPGVRSTALGRIGDRDPIRSMIEIASEDAASSDAASAAALAAPAGGGGLGGGGGGGGRGGR